MVRLRSISVSEHLGFFSYKSVFTPHTVDPRSTPVSESLGFYPNKIFSKLIKIELFWGILLLF